MMQKIRNILGLVQFSHSVFALPFALASVVFASNGVPNFKTVFLILIAIVFARTSAMAFNRWLDADLDAKNPRTSGRHLPQKKMKVFEALLLSLVAGFAFIGTSWLLGPLCAWLSPFVLVILFFYSFTKRFTDFTQLFLGLSLGLAPLGAWIAVKQQIEWIPVLIGVSVLFWVAGFDLIYATQDFDFDRKNRLHSLVVRLGIERALKFAKLFHLISFLLLLFVGKLAHVGALYFIGLIVMALLFWYQHRLVKPDDLSKVQIAFFTVNGCISFLFLISVILGVWLS